MFYILKKGACVPVNRESK